MATPPSGGPFQAAVKAMKNVPGFVGGITKDASIAKDLGIVSRRISKKVRKRNAASVRGRKSAASRGLGPLSRSANTLEILPCSFKEEAEDLNHGSRPSTRPVWKSPGGRKYRTFDMKKKLRAKGMDVDDVDKGATSDGLDVSTPVSSGSGVEGDETNHSSRRLSFSNNNVESTDMTDSTSTRESIVMEDGYFVGQVCQLQSFVEDINKTMKCRTKDCNGFLIPVQYIKVGLGGGLRACFACNGCRMSGVNFDSSTFVESSRRYQVSLALCLSTIVSGNTYTGYDKILGQGMGMETLYPYNFYTIIQDVYPHTRAMVQEHCRAAKCQMKAMPDDQMGSSKRAVTQADGTWGTRGFHSKNCTVTIRNAMNNALLYVQHLCQKGGDSVASQNFPNFKGTAKSGEGIGLELLWEQMAQDKINPEVHWQDGDSTSIKSFRATFPDEKKNKVMLCSGHVARSHQNCLNDLKSKKRATQMYISKHKEGFPEVLEVKCVCENKSHRKGCGCLTDAFIRQARINFFCCVVQADKNPDEFKRRLTALGKYHARDKHSWKDPVTKKKQKCDFHPAKTCPCDKKSKCKKKGEEPTCGKGTPYKSKAALSCPLHSLMYEIETKRRAEQAGDLIHPVLGRGNSNLPEASHNVLLRLRSKDVFLSRLHYIVKTDMGLLQSCITWEQATRPFGPDFVHWTVELFQRMKLPIHPGMIRNLTKALSRRKKDLEEAKTGDKKLRRIALKAARVLDSEERKQWVKKRDIQHSYGGADADSDSDCEPHAEEENARRVLQNDSQVVTRGKKRVRVVGLEQQRQTRGSKRKSNVRPERTKGRKKGRAE